MSDSSPTRLADDVSPLPAPSGTPLARAQLEARGADMRRAGLSMSSIARGLSPTGGSITRNAVIGIIARKYPELQDQDLVKSPPTLEDRCAALHRNMDELLARDRENRASYYVPASERMWITDGRENQLVRRTDPIPRGWHAGRSRTK